jgi:hypothetical protein
MSSQCGHVYIQRRGRVCVKCSCQYQYSGLNIYSSLSLRCAPLPPPAPAPAPAPALAATVGPADEPPPNPGKPGSAIGHDAELLLPQLPPVPPTVAAVVSALRFFRLFSLYTAVNTNTPMSKTSAILSFQLAAAAALLPAAPAVIPAVPPAAVEPDLRPGVDGVASPGPVAAGVTMLLPALSICLIELFFLFASRRAQRARLQDLHLRTGMQRAPQRRPVL